MVPSVEKSDRFRGLLKAGAETSGFSVSAAWETGLESFRVVGRREGVITSVIVPGVEVQEARYLSIVVAGILVTMANNIRLMQGKPPAQEQPPAAVVSGFAVVVREFPDGSAWVRMDTGEDVPLSREQMAGAERGEAGRLVLREDSPEGTMDVRFERRVAG